MSRTGRMSVAGAAPASVMRCQKRRSGVQPVVTGMLRQRSSPSVSLVGADQERVDELGVGLHASTRSSGRMSRRPAAASRATRPGRNDHSGMSSSRARSGGASTGGRRPVIAAESPGRRPPARAVGSTPRRPSAHGAEVDRPAGWRRAPTQSTMTSTTSSVPVALRTAPGSRPWSGASSSTWSSTENADVPRSLRRRRSSGRGRPPARQVPQPGQCGLGRRARRWPRPRPARCATGGTAGRALERRRGRSIRRAALENSAGTSHGCGRRALRHAAAAGWGSAAASAPASPARPSGFGGHAGATGCGRPRARG